MRVSFAFVAAVAAVALLCAAPAVQAKTYFKETFDGDWESRWQVSDWKQSEGQAGKFAAAARKWSEDEDNKGLQTTQDARFYAISAEFDEEIKTTKGKDLVIQLSVTHEQKIDCGGAYVKVGSTWKASEFGGETPYYIMFGPDICGTSTKKVHVIFNHQQGNGDNLLVKKDIRCETDQLTHVYTLIVHPDDTYEVRVDGKKKESGSLAEDWEFSPPKELPDMSVTKPDDWEDKEFIDDPEDEEPEGYADIPREVPDPDAEKPSDWEDDEDGEWTAPMVKNSEWYEWKPKQIKNENYKGPWVRPMKPNPDYKEYTDLHAYENVNSIGIDIWQVKSGTIFDNIIVTDSVEEAEAFLEETWDKDTADAEKALFDAAEAEKREKEAEERKRIEEERKKQDEEDEEDDEDEEDEEDEDEEDEEEDEEEERTHEEL